MKPCGLSVLCVCLILFPCISLPTGRACADESQDRALTLAFIDVGQGDAILVRTEGKALLIDAGDVDESGGKKVFAYLKTAGVRRLDQLLITHPHDDHYSGLLYLIGKIPIGKIYYGTRGTTSRYKRLEAMIAEEEIPYIHVSAGQDLNLAASVSLRVVHARGENAYAQWVSQFLERLSASASPAERAAHRAAVRDIPQADLNYYSVVVRLTHGSATCLLTGDATSEVEKKLVSQGAARCQLLKVAHHGSRYSSSKRFLDAALPTMGVIQVSANNSFGHPHDQALKRLKAACSVLKRNDHAGTIIATSNGSSFTLRTETETFALRPTTKRINRRQAFDATLRP